MLIKKFFAIAICFAIAGSTFAQQTAEKSIDKAVDAVETAAVATQEAAQAKAMLNEEGELVGKAVLTDQEDSPAADVKVSLTTEGKVVSETETDEEGNFAFASVAPGAYQVVGSADGLAGVQSYDVVGYSEGAVASPCSLGMCGASSDTVYDTCGQAPVSSLSSCSSCNACNACGGGGFGGGGGGLLGRGGGLFSNPRRLLLVGGLIGGLAAIDGEEASPAE